ncbi:MAG: hypothetical protein QOH95_1822 [Gaiellaceae bacterium]|nr:hypothetical protein [Gaiellaceae bacterium]
MSVSTTEVLTQDAIWEALRHAWFPVARSQDIEQPQLAILLGEELVVYRTEQERRPVVASNRCAHRGAGLHLGKVHGNTIACPYHGWRWSADDGRCTFIPALGERGVPPSKASVQTYPVREEWGLVWTCLETPVTDLPVIARQDTVEWAYGNGTPIHAHAGLAAATENFRDMAHFPFVHEGTFGPTPEYLEPFDVSYDGIEASFEKVFAPNADADPKMWPDSVLWQYHVVAPSFAWITFDHGRDGRHILLNISRPVSPEECVLYWVECLEPAFSVGTLDEWVEFEERVYAEDRPILESLRPREVPFTQPDVVEHSTRADKFTLAYRRAFREFVRRASALAAGDDVVAPNHGHVVEADVPR